jgi:DNA replication and repair protein RecF
MAAVRSDYERVLKQRAALLKSAAAARRAGDLGTLDVWDRHLADHGAELVRARLAVLRDIRPYAAAAYAQVAPASPPLTLHYASSLAQQLPDLGETESLPDEAMLVDAFLAELDKVRTAELERGINLVGPHRDDLELGLGDLPVRGYASHGEGWSTALALRLGSYELLRSDTLPGGDPVLLLDDVFAELDGERREQLALAAGKAEQAIVTAAVGSDVPEQLSAIRFDVDNGTVSRVG